MKEKLKKIFKGLLIGIIVISTIFVFCSECPNLNEQETSAMIILMLFFDSLLIGQILGIKSDELL